ncbi:hypothetical protein K443DRAFT_637649 [Laccaria amethystina LaAM-08-1]|uniref:Uncharacterized protein n=1 Tax=Laccaria amethystina LaAM-08-1 TaxID=1095629 RepID=A0A0C9XDT8_9AGAR|nr:hypothetical protein K443DRAFT_637649 [Laccaria amethystina LaAM-08-1]
MTSQATSRYALFSCQSQFVDLFSASCSLYSIQLSRFCRSLWTDVNAHFFVVKVLIPITPTVYMYEKRKDFTRVNVLGHWRAREG